MRAGRSNPCTRGGGTTKYATHKTFPVQRHGDTRRSWLIPVRRWQPAVQLSPAPARLHDEMAARERAAAFLEELQIVEPAAVGAPALLEPDRRCQRLLHAAEALDLALALQVLDVESVRREQRARRLLLVGEARAAAGLLPLVGVEGDGREHAAGMQRARGALDEGLGEVEVGGDQRGRAAGREVAELDLLGIGQDELDVGDRA